MNSIKRGRRRPRVRSVSFDVFFWVLAREVALRVVSRHAFARDPWSPERASICSVPTATLNARVRRHLNFLPDRRWFA